MYKLLYLFSFLSISVFIFLMNCSSDSSNSNYASYEITTESSSDYLYWDIQNIQMISPSFGWSIGRVYKQGYYHPIFLKCDNGLWAEDIIPSSNESILLENFHLLSFTNGWACGKKLLSSGYDYQGVIYHLSALKWSEVTLPIISTSWILNDLYFIDDNNGYAVGTIFKTAPSGNDTGLILLYTTGSWSTITPNLNSILPTDNWELRGIQMLDSSNGFSIGSNFSNKGLKGVSFSIGISWTETILPTSSMDYLLCDLSIVSTSFIYIIGESYNLSSSIIKKGYALFYDGISFSEASYPPISGNWNFVKCNFLSTTDGVILGNNITSNGSLTNGFLSRYQSSSWSMIPNPILENALTWEVKGLSVLSHNDIYTCGVEKYSQPITSSNSIPYIGKGIILRYNNNTWYNLSLPDISF